MKLVKPSIEHLDVTTDPLKAIELAGRTCYKSEDKITEDSAEKFVKMLIDRGHHAMIEHSNFTLKVSRKLFNAVLDTDNREYLRLSLDESNNGCIISGNLRAFMDFCGRPDVMPDIQRGIVRSLYMKVPLVFEGWLEDHLWEEGQYDFDVEVFEGELTVGEKLHHQVASYRIVCDRGVTHEIVRHRPFSYAQESTRYVNYKEGVEFVIPPWVSVPEHLIGRNVLMRDSDSKLCIAPIKGKGGCGFPSDAEAWLEAIEMAELFYKSLIDEGWKPQQARSVLPNSLKTEIVVTGNLLEWKHFFKLRCNKKAHPQMQEVANMILADMRDRVPGIFDEVE